MDSQVFSFFVEELTKEAVTVDDLYRGTTSAKNVNINPLAFEAAQVNQMGGGLSMPTNRQMNPALAQLKSNVEATKVQDFMRRIPLKSMQAGADSLELIKTTPSDIGKDVRGSIIISPSGVQKALPAIAGTSELSTPEAQKALVALTASHELAERRVAPKNIRRFQSHLAPEVLLKERNAIARLEGPGGREAADLMTKVRESTGEAQHMRNLLTRAYGPRAAQFLEGNEKVPKSMLRGLRRKLREDPSILEQADPAKSMGVLDKLKAAKEGIARQARLNKAIQSIT